MCIQRKESKKAENPGKIRKVEKNVKKCQL